MSRRRTIGVQCCWQATSVARKPSWGFSRTARRGRMPSTFARIARSTIPDLGALAKQFLRDADITPELISKQPALVWLDRSTARARGLTNIPWIVDVDAVRGDLAIPQAHLLNDLEALAWSVPVLRRCGDRCAARRAPLILTATRP